MAEERSPCPVKVVYFDCPSGAAGDMIMASLLDAGVSLDALRTELAKLPLTGWELVVREVRKGAFRATKVDVEIDHHAHHHHRTLGDIVAILDASTLGDDVTERADGDERDRKSTRLNSSHVAISYAVFCLKKKTADDVVADAKAA